MAQRRLLTYDELKDYGVNYTCRHSTTSSARRIPQARAVGEFRIGWVEQEIDDYVEAKISARSRRIGELGSNGTIKRKFGS
jgi:hypothetical protein